MADQEKVKVFFSLDCCRIEVHDINVDRGVWGRTPLLLQNNFQSSETDILNLIMKSEKELFSKLISIC